MPKLRLPTSNPGMSIPLSGLCPSRIQALKTGEIDLIYGSAELSYEDYNQAIAIDGIDGKFAPYGSTVRNIILNFNGNLADLSVRQALAYAIDKEAISEGLTYGYEPVAIRLFLTVLLIPIICYASLWVCCDDGSNAGGCFHPAAG